MGTYSKRISFKRIEDTPFHEIINHIINDGACQCYGDCDCIKNQNKFVNEDIRYTNDLEILINDKHPKTFSTLKNAKLSFES